MAGTLPTDYSALTLQRYGDLAAALAAQFPGRFVQLDCGPSLGVVPIWVSPPTQAELDALAATVAGWTWTDTPIDALNRVQKVQAALACLLVLNSASAAGISAAKKAKLQSIIDNQAAALVALVGPLL